MKNIFHHSTGKVIQPTASPAIEPSFTTSALSIYGSQGPSASGGGLPEFFRLPRAGSRDPLTGLSRSTLNLLVLPCESNGFRPPIKSISLRRKGALRGARLISTSSALAFLRRLESEQNPTGPETPQGQENHFEACRLDSEQKSPNPSDFIQPTTQASIEGFGGSEKE